MHPLPEVRTADLGGGGVLHQIEERDTADAAQPGLEVSQADGHILFQQGRGSLANFLIKLKM